MAVSAYQSSVPEGVDPLDLRQCIITTMREQQADFLRQAAENTKWIVQQQLRDNSVRDTLASIQSARYQPGRRTHQRRSEPAELRLRQPSPNPVTESRDGDKGGSGRIFHPG